MQTVGIPNIEERYTLDKLCDCNLQEYVSKVQLVADQNVRKRAIEIIDYLYSLVDNGTYDSSWKLQAQKMDLRNPSIKDLGNGYFEISAAIPENAIPIDIVEKEKKELKDALNQEISHIITQASLNDNDISRYTGKYNILLVWI